MAQEDFRTLYKTHLSSDGTLQWQLIPQHVNMIMWLNDSIDENHQNIRPLLNKLRTMFLTFKKGFINPDSIRKKVLECQELLEDWRMYHRSERPLKLINKMYELYDDFFEQWNESGAGIQFRPHDARREQKIRDSIVGASRKR